ncbi:hypothetical protein ABIA22_000362 [Sinorhizobium fredii]
MATVAALTAIASACSPADPKPTIKTVVVPVAVPESARQPCPRPVTLPDRAMTAREVTTGWGADRTALKTCEERRAAAVAAIDATGEPK